MIKFRDPPLPEEFVDKELPVIKDIAFKLGVDTSGCKTRLEMLNLIKAVVQQQVYDPNDGMLNPNIGTGNWTISNHFDTSSDIVFTGATTLSTSVQALDAMMKCDSVTTTDNNELLILDTSHNYGIGIDCPGSMIYFNDKGEFYNGN